MEWQLRLALAARRGAGPVGESLACCEACGAAIPEARRRAVPGVRLCVSCQQEAEDAG
ncbi:MAG: hypothetical protein PWQ57_901 [Desulfovibrionales bacterium]|nr:hypothetical protein [Desulfovibrionales bacterium]